MRPQVYYSPLETVSENLPKLLNLTAPWLDACRGQIGIKLHFGEEGNRNHIEPEYVRKVVEHLKQKGGASMLVETSTLYRGRRQDARSHLCLAQDHGFSYEAIGAPTQILDGLQGEAYEEVELNLPRVKRAKLAKGLSDIPFLVSLAHFKGHMLTGFGGSLKNLGMGLAAKGGKLDQHSSSKPVIDEDRCRGCGICIDYCPQGAIEDSDRVRIVKARCTGCAGCITACPEQAIGIEWEDVSILVSEKMAEYAFGVTMGRKVSYFNFLIRVTPNCDCYPATEPPICPDFGLFASEDPVACDQACLDRIRSPLSRLYPEIDLDLQLVHAEEIGLGHRDYRLVEL